MRMCGPFLDPVALTGVRLLSSALVYALLLTRWRLWPEFNRLKIRLLWLALLNTAVPFCLACWGAMRLQAGVASLLNATVPLFASLFALLWLREHLHSNQWLGIFFGFAGVTLLIQERSGIQVDFQPLAATLTILAAAMYGLCVNAVKRYFSGVDSRLIACGSTIWSALLLLPLACWRWPTRHVPAWAWAQVLWLGLMGTALAYLLYFDLLARIGPTRASAVTYLLPLFAMLWGWLLLHEPVTQGEMACGALIALAVWLVNYRRRNQA